MVWSLSPTVSFQSCSCCLRLSLFLSFAPSSITPLISYACLRYPSILFFSTTSHLLSLSPSSFSLLFCSVVLSTLSPSLSLAVCFCCFLRFALTPVVAHGGGHGAACGGFGRAAQGGLLAGAAGRRQGGSTARLSPPSRRGTQPASKPHGGSGCRWSAPCERWACIETWSACRARVDVNETSQRQNETHGKKEQT